MLSFPFLFFLFIYFVSFIMVVGANDWIVIWLGLEINMICFLAVMYDRCSILSVEACMKYYFVQGVASALFIVGLHTMDRNISVYGFCMMMVKVGGGPFYYWLVSVFLSLDWLSGWMLIVVQKMLPFWVSSSFLGDYVYLFVFMSLVIGAVGIMGQTMVKSLVIYSSIHHLGWIMVSMMVSWGLWIMYILMYGLIVGCVTFFMKVEQAYSVWSWLGGMKKWAFLLIVFNLGGVPPMFGFFLKMYVLFNLVGDDKMIFMALVVVSIMVLYTYLRLVFDMLVGVMSDLSFLSMLDLKKSSSLMVFSLLGAGFGAGLMWGF